MFVREPGIGQGGPKLEATFSIPACAAARAFDPDILYDLGCEQAPQASGVFPAFQRLPDLPPTSERQAAVYALPEVRIPVHADIMRGIGFERAYAAWDALPAFLAFERETRRFLSEGSVGMYCRTATGATMAVHLYAYGGRLYVDNPVFHQRHHLLTARFPYRTRFVIAEAAD